MDIQVNILPRNRNPIIHRHKDMPLHYTEGHRQLIFIGHTATNKDLNFICITYIVENI